MSNWREDKVGKIEKDKFGNKIEKNDSEGINN